MARNEVFLVDTSLYTCKSARNNRFRMLVSIVAIVTIILPLLVQH